MQLYSCGNKPGKLVAQQIKGNQTKTHISFLFHPVSKQKLTEPQAIANTFSAFYDTLYNLRDNKLLPQPDDNSIQAFLDPVHLPQLTNDQVATLNAPFMTLEIKKAIDSLPNNKAPGPDRFEGEYYKHLKNLLADHIAPMFNAAASSASFPQEMLKL